MTLTSVMIVSCSPRKNSPPVAVQSDRTVYFAALGDVRSGTLQGLVEHYRQKFGMQIRILPPMKLDQRDFALGRKQFVAEQLIRRMQENYPAQAGNPKDIVIGITDNDIYPTSENWRFCFGWRDGRAHMAVVSTARMGLHYLDQPLLGATSEVRLQKMVTKDLGILYFGRPLSRNPHSVMYDQILGIEELDEVSEDF